MITATRRIQFCAGHRVYGHESKCAHLHGHNYVALITAEAPELDWCGRVVDFSVLKDQFKGWIDECWDHQTILKNGDPLAHILQEEDQRVFVMDYNPTAENLARYLGEVVAPALLEGDDLRVTSVVMWETENCYAEWRLEG